MIYPELQGKVDGMSMRVPVADGSITDFVARISSEASAEDVNAAFQSAADGELSGILEYSEAPLVSSDIVGNKASCIFDSQLTMSNGGTVKVLGWYDNEWGYSNRTCDLAAYMGESSSGGFRHQVIPCSARPGCVFAARPRLTAEDVSR